MTAITEDHTRRAMAKRDQWARNRTILLLLLPGAGYLLFFFGLPLLRTVVGSFTNLDGVFTFDLWVELFSEPVYIDGLFFSLWLAIAPTVVALVISVLLAALLQATFPGRRIFGALYRIPLVVPGIVAAFLVMVMLDRGGMLSRIAEPLGIDLPRMVRDEWGIGAILASTWKNIPFMTLIIGGAMSAINRDVLHAARTLGAGRLTVLLRIQLPLALPGISAAVLLTFISSLGSYAIPNLLGPAYPLPLSVHMYEQGFRRGNWPIVYAMGTLLSVAAIFVLLAYYSLIGRLTGSHARREARS